METTLHDRKNFTKADIKNNKKKSCQWNDDNIKLLLSFLIEWKEEDDMDHNKKSGNDPIEVKYKAEVEEILDGNHPSLTPKLLESSLDQNDEVNIEKEALFNEITG
ncbi:unnamed protein product [Rhizophagus irregularis]|nr:unnamed protein product [Rhizophagus irregularis]